MSVDPVRAGRALLALSRVELRQYARHPGRALLIALLVMVPVAAIVGGGTLLRMIEPTRAERMTHAMGAAALAVETTGDYAEFGRVQALLPRDARVARLFQGAEDVRSPGRRLRARSLAAAPGTFEADGPGAGLVLLTHGSFPAHSGEVALSPALMKGLGVVPGDSVVLAYGPRRVISGVVIDTEALDQALVVRTAARVESRGAHRLLVDVPPESAAVVAARLTRAGFGVARRADAGAGDPAALALVGLVGGIGLLEAALVVAAAFAVSLRRRQHEIGLLGSVGAAPGAIGAALLVSTGLLAAAGALAGAVVGLGAAAALQPFLDAWNRRANGGLEVAWAYVVGGVLLGSLTAVLAAALPARQAARLPIRQALGGRRPAQQPAHIWLRIGLGMLGVGLALLLLLPRTRPALTVLSLLGGSVLGVLGFGALCPWLLEGLARRAAALPLALRLAVRDAGRFRARNGPVVTAVLAGMATSVTVAALVASVESTIGALPARYRADQLWIEGPAAEELARRLGKDLNAVALAPLAAAYLQGQPVLARFDTTAAGRGPGAWVALGDETLLRAFGLEAAAPDFQAGRLLAFDAPAGAAAAELTIGREARVIGRAAVRGVASAERVEDPRFFLARSSGAAEAWEAGPPPRKTLFPWIVRLNQPVTAEVLARAQALAAAQTGTTVDAARLHRGPTRTLYHVLLGLCLLTGLVVVLLATALSAAESEEDVYTLHTVGAPPALIRAQRAARAGYLAFLGCALAVPAGLIPAVGLLKETNIGLGFVLPWRDLLIVLFGLPALAAGIAWCAGPGGGVVAGGGRPGRALLLGLLLGPLLGVGGAGAGPSVRTGPARAVAPAIRWEPRVGRAVDGSPLPGELGRIRVPENRRTGGGATLELAFVRYRTTNPHPGPPIIFLEGGPGGSGVDGCAFVATHPLLRFLEQCDVIGLDQRGTGLSQPNLGDPDFSYALPLDRAATRAAELGAFQDAARRAVAWWSARGVDLAAYNTEESADDVDDLRAALGLERVVIYGSSYGSHLGLCYLRRHAEHVARAVLVKVEGPDQTWKRPATTQRQLELIHARTSADPEVGRHLPDFLGAVRTLLGRLERAPVTVALPAAADSAHGASVGSDSLQVTVGPYDLRCALARALASTRQSAGLADFVYQCTRENWTPLAERALVERRGSLGSAMALMMDCASGATAERRRGIAAERADPINLLGDALDAPFYPETCAACGHPDLGDAFRGPLRCAVPVLFVSGELDARTPPANVQEIRAGFTRSTHIRVTNAGHDSRELISEEYRGLLQAFLRGESVPDCKLELPFRFEPIRADTSQRGPLRVRGTGRAGGLAR